MYGSMNVKNGTMGICHSEIRKKWI